MRYPLLKNMGCASAGFHTFRRFRESVLQISDARNLLIDFWMGHANGEMAGRYGKQLLANIQWRQECAATVGLGFALPTGTEESVLNDGTAVVLFGILFGAVVAEKLSVPNGVVQYFLAVAGGALLGAALGFLASRTTGALDDPQIEITLTTILAYGNYLLAFHLHLSGVIATASAGLMLGNFGAKGGMSARTRTAMQSFWEYISFVMNSLVFLLIGLEIHVRELLQNWTSLVLVIAAVLLGRVLSVYLLVPLSNRFSDKIPIRWQHVAVWGGLRGALALVLALSLPSTSPYREQILNLTFGVVIFSILVQGLTIKPLLNLLKLANGDNTTSE